MTQITLLSAEPANLDQWAFLNSVRLEETEKKKTSLCGCRAKKLLGWVKVKLLQSV